MDSNLATSSSDFGFPTLHSGNVLDEVLKQVQEAKAQTVTVREVSTLCECSEKDAVMYLRALTALGLVTRSAQFDEARYSLKQVS